MPGTDPQEDFTRPRNELGELHKQRSTWVDAPNAQSSKGGCAREQNGCANLPRSPTCATVRFAFLCCHDTGLAGEPHEIVTDSERPGLVYQVMRVCLTKLASLRIRAAVHSRPRHVDDQRTVCAGEAECRCATGEPVVVVRVHHALTLAAPRLGEGLWLAAASGPIPSSKGAPGLARA